MVRMTSAKSNSRSKSTTDEPGVRILRQPWNRRDGRLRKAQKRHRPLRRENLVSKRCPHLDKVLGLSESISRRDFLEGALVASTGLLTASSPLQLLAQGNGADAAAWSGYTGEGDYKSSAGNSEQVVQNAHAVRDGAYDRISSQVTDTGEIYDCAIVGGGFSGLSAALFFQQRTRANRNCIVLDNASIFGGVAKRNEFVVDGHRLYAPQASVHFQPPYPDSFLETVYAGMGLDWDAFKSYQKWQGPKPEMWLPRSPYGTGKINGKEALGFYFGAKYGHKPGIWVTDPWGKGLEGTPFSETTRKEMLARWAQKPVVPPLVYDYPGDAVSRQLDSMTLEDYFIRTYGISRETVRLMDASEAAGGCGVGPDALSAFLVYEWSKIIPTVDDSMESGIQMFPGGNSGMTRLMVKTMIPGAIDGPRSMDTVWKGAVNFGALDQPDQRVRLRLDSTAVRVEHMGEPGKAEFVSIEY